MNEYVSDKRVVLTLDAGGTNMVFGAMQGAEFIVEPITLPSNSDNLDLCLKTMAEGFQMVWDRLAEDPVAISFAFPGPADYPNGIIGGYLPNFPSFRDGVALGPFLEEKFGIPVFINNDGDLFAYGEALCGAYHPALGEMAMSERFLRLCRAEIERGGYREGSIHILVNPKRVSVMSGQKRCNKTRIMSEYGFCDVHISGDEKLGMSEVLVVQK